ncbi:Coatomer protein complex, gamma sub-unit [Balamuthia mandrillaris]
MLDYGYPQVLSTEALKAFVFNEAVLVDDAPPPSSKDVGALGIYALNKLVDNLSLSSPGPAAKDKPLALTMKDERNHKNELFVDLIERLTVLFSPQGTKLKAEINGFIRMTSFLKGTPEVRLALNEDLVVGRRDDRSARYGLVTLDDITFHECARLDLFEMDRSLSLHPPDGEFVLLNYRISEDFALPFYITPIVEQPQTGGPYRVDLMIKIRLDIPDDQQAVNVIIKCPLPKCVESANCELHLKGVSYQVNKNVAEWSIQEFAGGSDLFLRCRITLKEVYDATIRKEFGPISLDFELPMHNCSNVQIRYLRVVERDKSYNPLRWMKEGEAAKAKRCEGRWEDERGFALLELLDLPNELLLAVFQQLDFRTVVRSCRRTCRRFIALADAEQLWRHYWERYFDATSSSRSRSGNSCNNKSWRDRVLVVLQCPLLHALKQRRASRRGRTTLTALCPMDEGFLNLDDRDKVCLARHSYSEKHISLAMLCKVGCFLLLESLLEAVLFGLLHDPTTGTSSKGMSAASRQAVEMMGTCLGAAAELDWEPRRELISLLEQRGRLLLMESLFLKHRLNPFKKRLALHMTSACASVDLVEGCMFWLLTLSSSSSVFPYVRGEGRPVSPRGQVWQAALREAAIHASEHVLEAMLVNLHNDGGEGEAMALPPLVGEETVSTEALLEALMFVIPPSGKASTTEEADLAKRTRMARCLLAAIEATEQQRHPTTTLEGETGRSCIQKLHAGKANEVLLRILQQRAEHNKPPFSANVMQLVLDKAAQQYQNNVLALTSMATNEHSSSSSATTTAPAVENRTSTATIISPSIVTTQRKPMPSIGGRKTSFPSSAAMMVILTVVAIVAAFVLSLAIPFSSLLVGSNGSSGEIAAMVTVIVVAVMIMVVNVHMSPPALQHDEQARMPT